MPGLFRTTSRSRVRRLFGIAFAATLVAPANAPAQKKTQVSYSVTPYLFAAGLSGTVGVRERSATVDASFVDILENLRMGAMIRAEARRQRVSVAGDLIYTSIHSSDGIARGERSLDIAFNQTTWMVNLTGGYAAISQPNGYVDITLGARYWNLGADLGATTGAGAQAERSGSRGWVDAVVGATGRMTLRDRWRLWGLVDAGGGGSRNTGQFVGLGGYDFSTLFLLSAGYRYLAVDYDRRNFLDDTRMGGALLTFTFRFY